MTKDANGNAGFNVTAETRSPVYDTQTTNECGDVSHNDLIAGYIVKDSHTQFVSIDHFDGGNGNNGAVGVKGGESLNQADADYIGNTAGGFLTIGSTAAESAKLIGGFAVKSLAIGGAAVSVGVAGHAYMTGQLQRSHEVDAAINLTLTILTAFPLTTEFGLAGFAIYGGIRLIAGEAIDEQVNEGFPIEH